MTQRTVDVNTVKGATASDQITTEELAAKRKERKAKLAEVLDRGVVGDRLNVPLPENMHGEWVHKDDIVKKKALGFTVADKSIAPESNLHDAGDGSIRIGDVVFMVTDRETKELIDEVKKERFNRVHAPKGGKQKEEKDFEGAVDITSQPSVESNVRKANAQDITSALEAVNRQKTS